MKRVMLFLFVMLMLSCLRGQNNTFTDINAGLPGVLSGSVAWGDYDNDGDLDVLLQGLVYRNNGNQTFTDIVTGLSGGVSTWGDFDNDGDLDILLTGEYGTKIYSNNGNSTFTNINAGLTGVVRGSVACGDYNNDGNLDILLTGYTTTGTCVSKIYRNNGNCTFTDIMAGLSGVQASSIAWGDYDNDGDLDIILAGYTTTQTCISKIYRNNGNSTFTDLNAGLTGVYHCSVAWGDYDNDGDLDILLLGDTGSTGITRIYRNNGNSTFTNINSGLEDKKNGAVAWGDYDNDGYLDILLSGNYQDHLFCGVYRNNGNGIYTYNANILYPYGMQNGSVAWGDYDNDGDLDVLLTGQIAPYDTDNTISRIYRNNGGSNYWLEIETQGVMSNANGLGARISCSTTNSQYREIASGNGWVNGIAHFGLGNQNSVDQIHVYWPKSGITDVHSQVQAAQRLIIYEGNLPLICLLPNGGEIVAGATGQNHTYPITWTIENPPVSLHHITLSYSLDGGLTFPNLISDNEVNDGIFTWTVPSVSSSTVRVKIQLKDSLGNLLAEKISGTNLTIDATSPLGSITLTAPLENEWVSGTPYFDWSATGLTDVTNMAIIIDGAYLVQGLSTAASNSFYQTPDSLSLSNGQHTWTVRGLDIAGNWVQATQTWSITADTTRINIHPNGGVILAGAPNQNHTYPITWTIENPPVSLLHISLYYSLDGGLTYPNLIADNEPNDDSFTWVVPNIASTTVRIKLQVKNSSGVTIAEKTSAGNFTIDANPPTGSITLTAPLNGAWVSSTPYLDWSATGLTDVTNMAVIVDGAYLVQGLSTTAANSFYQIPDSLALSDGWHTWTVRGLDTAGNWVQATQSWSIRVDATPPSQFSLNTPTNDIWLATKTPTFSWNPSMDNGSGMSKYQVFVNNTLKKDNIPATATQWTAASGSFSDNCESGLSNWNTTGAWGLSSSNPHSGSYCITDSPTGQYGNNQNYAITLAQPILLQGASSLSLNYWYRYDLDNFDHVYVEVSSDGSYWTQIADYTYATIANWTQAIHNLNSYANQPTLYIRFRIFTSNNWTRDGFYFDDLSVMANGIEFADGNYTWCVKAVDNVGNIQPSTETRTLHIDSTAPHAATGTFANLTPANNAWSADSLITFTWKPCVDDGIGFDHYELWVDGAICKDSLTVTHYQLQPSQVLANGNHNWYVKAYDGLGNVATSAQFVLKIDRVAPADFTLLTPANNSYFTMPTPTFTWNTTTDAGCGFGHYELWIDGVISVDNLSQATSTPAMGLSEGSHSWKVYAVDNLGNKKQSTAVWTTIGDWNPPTQPILTSPINNQIVSVSRPMMTWQKSSDAGTGVHHYRLYIDQLAPVTVTPADINAPIVSYQAPSALANGNHSWYVKAYDNATGESSSSYGAFIVDVDTTPPTSSIINPLVNQYIGGVSYLISGTASDNTGGSGVQKVEISFDGGNNWLLTTHNSRSGTRGESQFAVNQTTQLERIGNKSNLLASNSNIHSQDGNRDVYNWQYNWTGYQTGSVTIKTRATDMNNNVEAPPYSLPVFVEKIAPVIQSLNASPNYAKAGTVNFTIVFQTGAHCSGMNNSVTPTVTITPAGGTARAVTQTSYQGNTWTGQTTIAQSDLNGTAVINVSNAKDNINNQMLPNATHTFVIDTIAPTAFNLISPPTGAWLNVNRPQLTWGAATDVSSGIDHYALEIDGSTSSPGISNISPTLNTIQPAAALTMGTHNWRIKAYDRAGNSTWSSATFSFGLDLTPPVSAIAAPTNNSTIGGLSYTISGTSSDGTGTSSSGVGSVQIRINNGSWLNTVNTGTGFNTWTYAWTGYTSGTFTLQSRATDSAGNVETSPLTTSVTVNLNPPTVQSITVTPNPAKVGTVTCNALFTVNSSGLNNSIHPTIWFTTPNGSVVNFSETSFSGNLWVGTATITGTTQNGTGTVHVTGITDNYNNTMAPNQNAGTFIIDTVAPTVSTISVNPQITNIRTDLGVQVNFTEITAGLNPNISPVVTIIPLGASPSDYISVTQTGYNASTRVWSGVATITSTTPEGLASVKVASAADMAGNVMQLTTLQDQFTIDRSAPTVFSILQPVEGGWTANRQPTISWSPSSDTVSGLSAYQLIVNGDQVGNNILPTVTSTTVQTSLPDNAYSIRVKALDNAQVPNERLSGTAPTLIHVDGSAPTSLISSPDNGYVVQGNSVAVSGTATDGIGNYAGIGVKYVKLSKNGGGVWDTVYTALSQVQGSVNWNWNYTDLTPGNYTVSVKAIDWLDNEELTTSSIVITVEATTPTAHFTASPATGVAPLNVEFMDTSISGSWPIANWSWNFGDGSATSTLQNPTHVYTSRGVYSVSLTVSDAYNTSNSITMTDMINVTNQAPTVILPLPDVIRNEDFTPIVIDLSNHFQDGDGDALSYSVEVDPAWVNATITNNNLTIYSITDVFGTVNVIVEANDQYPPLALVRSGASKNRATCTDAFLLLINPVNDAPEINLPNSLTFAEDGSLVVDMTPFVSDVDSPNLTITSQNSEHVSVEISGLNATLTATDNWNGTETVSFTVSDGALTATGQTSVNVSPVNDPPSIDLPPSFTFAEDENLPVNVALFASDIDNANLTLTISGNVNVTVAIVGLDVTLGALLNWNGIEHLIFTVSDNMGRAIASDSTNIIVSPVNDAPIISSFSPEDTTLTLQLNNTQLFSLIASDVDSDISYSWFINEVNQNVSLSTFEYQFTQSSTHIVKVAVTDGIATVEQIWTVSIPVVNDDPSVTPLITRLYPNYPNPFNPETTIQYSLKSPGWVDISIYNIAGQLIRDLKKGIEESGMHSITWNGRDNDNQAVASGLYYVRMRSNDGFNIMKMMLMK